MSLQKIQDEVDKAIKKYTTGYWPPLSMLARLMEEVGELARVVNHHHGNKPLRDDEFERQLSDEIGDIIFTIACMGNSYGVNLETAYLKAVSKLRTRDRYRFRK